MANATSLQLQLDRMQAEMQDSIDTVWLLFNGALVFFMQCGFGMLEAGAVKSKSTQNIMLKNLFDASIGGILWWLIGYGIKNEAGNAFMGIAPSGVNGQSKFATSDLMLAGAGESTGPAWALVFFEFTFAAASSTIVSGAVAERAQLPAYLFFTSLITGIIYPTIAHWVWSPVGWLSYLNKKDALLGGVIDFAGSGCVHLTGGIAAVIGATITGPRTGRFDQATGAVVPMPGHSPVLQVLGTFILWLGWYGFNAGSTMTINAKLAPTAGRIHLTTTLGACGGGICAVVLERYRGKRRTWDAVAMCNGILAGLVSVTAGCATIPPWAALMVGVAGAGIYRVASKVLLQCKVDDPLDAFAVHGACGLWGLLACALFTTPEFAKSVAGLDHAGLFSSKPGGELLVAALVLIAAQIAFVGSLSVIVFLGLKKMKLLRVSLEDEMATGAIVAKQMADMDGSTYRGQMYAPTSVVTDTSVAAAQINVTTADGNA